MSSPTTTQQQIAIEPAAARLLVQAGPGTGKTETVAYRLGSLISQGVGPGHISVLSFSRNAVRTLLDRIEKLTRGSSLSTIQELRHVSIRTFDSWTFRQLRLLGYPPADLLRNGYEQNIALLIAEMQGERRSEIKNQLQHLRHVIVDEFQDLAGVRGALVLELFALLVPPRGGDCGFTILGDEAQAIYGFTLGASDSDEFNSLTSTVLFSTVRKRYKSTLKPFELEKNFRATPDLSRLVSKARTILQTDESTEDKLEAIRHLLRKLPDSPCSSAPTVLLDGNNGSASILCRTNGEALRLAELFAGKEDAPPPIRIRVAAGSAARAVPAWIGAILGPFQGSEMPESQFRRIYDKFYGTEQGRINAGIIGIPSADVAWDSLFRLAPGSAGSECISIPVLRERICWPDQLPDDMGLDDGAINITTVHQSKGMEYDSVGILKTLAGMVDSEEEADDEISEEDEDSEEETEGLIDASEEPNILFVAISRASRQLQLLEPDRLYPLYERKFDKGRRTRWFSWKFGKLNLEIGHPDDIDPFSFVATECHGTAEAVKEVQEYLRANAAPLVGRKVVLCKAMLDENKVAYDIHLQENQKPGLKLGRTTSALTFDINGIINKKGGKKYYLPGQIYNLRITNVSTIARSTANHTNLASPWSVSGLWLGITIHGLGFFKPGFRKG